MLQILNDTHFSNWDVTQEDSINVVGWAPPESKMHMPHGEALCKHIWCRRWQGVDLHYVQLAQEDLMRPLSREHEQEISQLAPCINAESRLAEVLSVSGDCPHPLRWSWHCGLPYYMLAQMPTTRLGSWAVAV